MRLISSSLMLLSVVLILVAPISAQEVTITPDVVYGHKFGLAMTYDVFTPSEKANGAGVLFMVSGGWFSHWRPPEQNQKFFQPLTEQGFTVFAVRHGSSPKFSIPEAVSDVRRAVRHVRMKAADYRIDPDRIGVFGMSAGGHLSLVLGTASDEGDPKSNDPVERVSSRVNAVVAYVAPTDLRIMVSEAPDRLPDYERFPALTLDLKAAEEFSPLVHVTPDDAPTLLLAGAKDELVPISHSRLIRDAFEREKVVHKLVEFPDAGHGFQGDDQRNATREMVSWFVDHLSGEAAP